MLSKYENKNQNKSELEKNVMFVTTIYDTFEALEETLGKLKLERPLFLTYIAKMAFADEVFKLAEDDKEIHLRPKKQKEEKAFQTIH